MSGITEDELFAGYKTLAGYAAQCVCGGWIDAPSSATLMQIAERVRIHNESTDHRQWAQEQRAVDALRHREVHVCSCHGKGAA